MKLRTGWIAALACVPALLFATTAAGSASAATSQPPSQNFTFSFVLHKSGASAAASPAVTVRCNASVSLPAVSGTTMTGVGSIYCNFPMSALGLTVGLVKNGSVVATSSGINYGKSYIVKEAKKACTAPYRYHNWQVLANGNEAAPPGFVPPYVSFAIGSPVISILC